MYKFDYHSTTSIILDTAELRDTNIKAALNVTTDCLELFTKHLNRLQAGAQKATSEQKLRAWREIDRLLRQCKACREEIRRLEKELLETQELIKAAKKGSKAVSAMILDP